MALRTEAVAVEVAEADNMAAEVVVVAVDLVDETTTTTSMVLTFLIPIAALVPTTSEEHTIPGVTCQALYSPLFMHKFHQFLNLSTF